MVVVGKEKNATLVSIHVAFDGGGGINYQPSNQPTVHQPYNNNTIVQQYNNDTKIQQSNQSINNQPISTVQIHSTTTIQKQSNNSRTIKQQYTSATVKRTSETTAPILSILFCGPHISCCTATPPTSIR